MGRNTRTRVTTTRKVGRTLDAGRPRAPRKASAPAPVSDPALPRVGPGLLLRPLLGLPPGMVFQRLARPLRGTSRRVARAAGAGPGRVEPAARGPLVAPTVPDRTWTAPGTFRFAGIARD